MKKVLLLISLFLIIVPAFSQELVNKDINQVDDQGRRQGQWKAFDVNGKLKFEGAFIDNMPVGTFTYYYKNGKVKAVSHMYDGGKRSRTKVYHENSRLMAEGNYLNKMKDSTWVYYSDFDGVLLSHEHYENGLLEGTVINFYPKGSVAEEIAYKAGLKHGDWKRFFTDGKLKLKATYLHDKLEGLMLVYHQNGFPEVSGMYKNNLKDGMWVYYDDQGIVFKKERYLRGNLKETILPESE